MPSDTEHRPRLRPLEAFRFEHTDALVGLRDRTGFSPRVLSISPAALHLISLFDGMATVDEVCERFASDSGQPVALDVISSVIDQLNSAWFLEGLNFDTYYEQRLTDYRLLGIRSMPYAAALGIDSTGAVFTEILANCDRPKVTGILHGLVVPHLDYPRGAPCYGAGYSTLTGRQAPRRVVILGTNHFGRSTSVVATSSSFETPLGVTSTDVELLEKLERECGPLRQFELDHEREHSVELQVAWLQNLYGCGNFQIVAFLCPDPCGPSGTRPYDGQGVDLRDFAEALRRLIADDGCNTLLVAGADLSHVGAEFGDDPPLDDAFLDATSRSDLAALEWLEIGVPDPFLSAVSEKGNPTRICSVGCMYVLGKVLEGHKVSRLAYHQAVDHDSQTCVTSAALAYTSPS